MKIYEDKTRSAKERASALVAEMTFEEKITQLQNHAAPIPRLNVPHYEYWNEASHGYFGPFKYDKMDVTSFPVCLAMSQSWDPDKIKEVASAISDEIRAYHNIYGYELNDWCPTINLARDPRNGRSDENFGEDPFLTGKLAIKYVQGMQGDDPNVLKTCATPKHYALNSSENNRHNGSSNVDEATLREYYTRQFRDAVLYGHAQSIMTSYNRVNGVPASANEKLLTHLLREEWGFDGFVVSDCGAVSDVYENIVFNDIMNIQSDEKTTGHYYAKNLDEAAAISLSAGTDLSCGEEYQSPLVRAVKNGLISEDVINRALTRIFTVRFRLGLFDEEGDYAYRNIGWDDVCTAEKQKLCLDIADDSIVLLKNDDALLPLSKDDLKGKKVLVIGPNAIYRELGGYSCGSNRIDTTVNVLALDGIKNALKDNDTEVLYEKGWCCGKEFREGVDGRLPGADNESPDAIKRSKEADAEEAAEAKELGLSIKQLSFAKNFCLKFMAPGYDYHNITDAIRSPKKFVTEDPDVRADDDMLFERALTAAKDADIVIIIAGTDASNASEENDRTELDLPYGQNEKIEKMIEANPNTIVVINALGAVTGSFFDKAHTIINEHFAGQEQGTALADVLFGKVNPNAKLTATWYRNMDDLPPVNDYGIYRFDTVNRKGRTYQYFKGSTLFPFGYGLSYTSYDYADMKITKDGSSEKSSAFDANDTMVISADISNTGKYDGKEIVELYVSKVIPEDMHDKKPARQLKGFTKIFIKAGTSEKAVIKLPVSELAFWSNLKNKMVVEPGDYVIELAKSSSDIVLTKTVHIDGVWDAPLAAVTTEIDRTIIKTGETACVNTVAVALDTSRILNAALRPVYSVSDTSVATIDANGLVTAIAPGTALISADVTYNGKTMTGTVPVTVR
ncbi:exo-1,4-beta-glucosidase [Lachnospiraceae bacterium XPB1003]|nr:exo-1,4-beta-glucosidase [Lachnospiraceae bacterium XPB1003]